jgi:Flp pilus assembly pilin Flp
MDCMDRIRALMLRLHAQSGQTMAEYGILITAIAVIVVVVAALLGANITSLFSQTSSHI